MTIITSYPYHWWLQLLDRLLSFYLSKLFPGEVPTSQRYIPHENLRMSTHHLESQKKTIWKCNIVCVLRVHRSWRLLHKCGCSHSSLLFLLNFFFVSLISFYSEMKKKSWFLVVFWGKYHLWLKKKLISHLEWGVKALKGIFSIKGSCLCPSKEGKSH